MSEVYNKLRKCLDIVRSKTDFSPKVALVLGSGLGGYASEIEVKETKILDYNKTKNIYIPAERNFVSVIPNLGKYNETNDNIMNLIYDWFTAKKYFPKQYSLPILNFGINYYYQKGADLDMLILNNIKKEIPLNTGSSGLQSVTPLIIIFEYLSTIFYREVPLLSVKEKDELNRLLVKMTEMRGEITVELNNEESAFKQRREKYAKTQFIIEEPEQNLFPEAQRDLVYYLLQKLQSEREHTLTITTHSPYILYALNNCMMAGLVHEKMKEADKIKLKCLSSKIAPKDVSIYEIKDGIVDKIQRENGLISTNYFDQKMKELMDDFYTMLNYYGK